MKKRILVLALIGIVGTMAVTPAFADTTYDLYQTNAEAATISSDEAIIVSSDETLTEETIMEQVTIETVGNAEVKESGVVGGEEALNSWLSSMSKNGEATIMVYATTTEGITTYGFVRLLLVDTSPIVSLDASSVRSISEKYLSTLGDDSLWLTDEEYSNVLDSALAKMEQVESSETEESVEYNGQTYTKIVAGSGTTSYVETYSLDADDVALIQSELKNRSSDSYEDVASRYTSVLSIARN
ncbi:hypothetical protein [Eubacterium oxidoreducens]|uniref:TPM domain-containing protein n=1 Tax=Eubacterium oxidoreducens TaxID=1732 RepID=A0A1G6C404_EUBOX|nr:hypothetical protein [Eubacterium oxidoreducens]SDB27580.1 hypothetical protein SAMN02910417_02049 [Eubacterium oxidoreducens]